MIFATFKELICFIKPGYMKLQEKILADVRASLAGFPQVEEKKMFGKLAFMVNHKLCIAVGKETSMCRIDPALHGRTNHQTAAETVIMRGREMKGYVRINNNDLQDKRRLKY